MAGRGHSLGVVAETPTSFVAECFWVGVKQDDLAALDRRVEVCVIEMIGGGESIRCGGADIIFAVDLHRAMRARRQSRSKQPGFQKHPGGVVHRVKIAVA